MYNNKAAALEPSTGASIWVLHFYTLSFSSSCGPDPGWQLLCRRSSAKTRESFSERLLPKSSFPLCSHPSLLSDK